MFFLFVCAGELNETEKVELLMNLHLIHATGEMIIPTAMVYLSFTKPVLVHVLLKHLQSLGRNPLLNGVGPETHTAWLPQPGVTECGAWPGGLAHSSCLFP